MPPKYSVIYVTEVEKLVGAKLAAVMSCVNRGDLTEALLNIGWAQNHLEDLEDEIRGVRFAYGERD